MSYSAPRGTQDILPKEIPYWDHIEKVTADIFRRFGYQQIRTPIFEQTELFSRSIGTDTDIVEKEMYTFPDKKGRSMTLRPEGTAPIVRAYLEHKLGAQDELQKLWYSGPMFRYERPQAGRYRQFHQMGCEIFGTRSPQADAEVIELAVLLFQELGLKDLEVSVNSVGCSACRPLLREKLKDFLNNALPHLCEDCQRRAEKNPLRVLDCKNPKCRKYLADLPKLADSLCPECTAHFQAVLSTLDRLGIQYKYAPTLVRGLDYYTKTVFEVVSKYLGAQDAVCGGGRYDDLVHLLGGPSVPAVGFAFGMERTVLVLQEQKVVIPAPVTKKIYCALLGTAAQEQGLSLVRDLRVAGLTVEMAFDDKSLKAQLKRADRIGAEYVVIIGDDEVVKKVVQLKNMRTGEQKEVPVDKIVPGLTSP